MQSVLTQAHGGKMRLIAYHSTKFDPEAQGFTASWRAVAVASYAVQTTESIVLGSTFSLQVPHAVTAVLLKARTQHLSASRATTCELLQLTAPNVTIEHCPTMNPAPLLPTAEDREPHDSGGSIAHIHATY